MRFFFIVQGEGRGHMTQAISLSQILEEGGHEICHVVIGKSKRRKVPEFFKEKIEASITALESPNFVTDKDHKSVKPLRTVVYSMLKSPVYRKSLKSLHKLVKEHQPDVIINFYDFLGGLYNFYKRPKARFICIAHQYLVSHPDFEFPKGRQVERASLRIANRITRLGADKVLALSFKEFAETGKRKLFVAPPLLRRELDTLQITHHGHILAYMVNPGYGEEVQNFHQSNPEIAIHCFWDQKDKPETWKVDDKLSFHQLNDKKFLEKMASSNGYITTAGFESVCEAMYLGKPVMMIPVQGQYEQACNAIDAVNAGAGISNEEFDIKKLVDFIPSYEDTSAWFRQWANGNKPFFLKHLTTF